LPGLARKLPHYGKYSYLGFTGDNPDNQLKGNWQVTNSPMQVSFDSEAVLQPVEPRPPLAQLPAAMNADSMREEVAYLASAANSITDALALKGMNLVVDHLETAIQSGQNLQARSGMLEGSLLTGAAMLHAGLGLMHAIGNVTGGLYHELPHGLILMRCMNAVLEYNLSTVGEKYQDVRQQVEKIQQITDHQFQRMDVPVIGIKKNDLQLLAQRAVANVNAKTNPRPAGVKEVKQLVQQSFEIQ
jgi:alcohol dehydrogenase